MVKDYLYYKDIFKNKALPLAFVDLDLLDKNITDICTRARNKNIRIATKSIRCIHIIKYILQTNSIYKGVMCYSADEAIYLAEQGIDDILIAYPITNLSKIENVCDLIKKGKKIVFMCDSKEHLEKIQTAATNKKTTASICIDVDMSMSLPALHFGVRRSPLSTPQQVLKLVEQIQSFEQLKFIGIMGYEAQIAGLGDFNPNNNRIMNFIIRYLKKKSVHKIKKLRQETVEILKKNGCSCTIVNGGGTGSLETTSVENCITEVTVGSGFYASHLFDYYHNFKHLPAAAYAIEITRKPTDGIFTCHGGGYVASGTGADKIPRPFLPFGSQLLSTEGAGEVQTPIVYKGKENLNLGDPIFMRHSKAGELCENFNSLYLVRGNKIIDVVSTYRGDSKCFL